MDALQREPVLCMCTTFALHQSEGTTPVSSELLKIMVRIGAIYIASCFRIIGLILPVPVAYVVLLSCVVT